MINRLPEWFKQDIVSDQAKDTKRVICGLGINTVCQSAKCPNINSCFKNARPAFMVLGDTCTRSCAFCAVKKAQGERLINDPDEPFKIAQAVKQLKIRHALVTSVTRDDLADGGAAIFAMCLEAIRDINDNVTAEVLIPDFKGEISSLRALASARPAVIAHNLETVRRLYGKLRPQADYARSLEVLKNIKLLSASVITKTSMMLGLGEREEEVVESIKDIKDAGCDILTLGQYLAPSKENYPVKEFISPDKFRYYQDLAVGLGFKGVLSGPLVRSSYKAQELYNGVSEFQMTKISRNA
ncbi:MAG: lipoyl synthase [Candidatus Omnitrophica bacterium]|nr:lipoyl synthase [Candidatus Omnitrophota bacterium]